MYIYYFFSHGPHNNALHNSYRLVIYRIVINIAINGGADAVIRGARSQKLSNIGQIYFCFV